MKLLERPMALNLDSGQSRRKASPVRDGKSVGLGCIVKDGIVEIFTIFV